MSMLVEWLATYLDQSGVPHRRVADDRIQVDWSTDWLDFDVLFQEREHLLMVVAPRVSMIPERNLAEASRTANRVNAERLRWGAFSVDTESRSLGFRLTVPMACIDGSGLATVRLILETLGTVLVHLPAFAPMIWDSNDASDSASGDI